MIKGIIHILFVTFPFRNYYLVFGLISETCLAVFLAYCPGISTVLGMYGLRLVTLPSIRTHTLKPQNYSPFPSKVLVLFGNETTTKVHSIYYCISFMALKTGGPLIWQGASRPGCGQDAPLYSDVHHVIVHIWVHVEYS